MKVAVTGSSGPIGTALAASLRSDGHQVVRLVRRTPRSADEVRWDPSAADAGLMPPGPEAPGALEGRLLPPARLGVCPRFASGAQVMSWISLTDEIGAIRFLLDREDISGPVNLTARSRSPIPPSPPRSTSLSAAGTCPGFACRARCCNSPWAGPPWNC